MADRDHARHAGRSDDGQKQQEAAKGHLSDRRRKRSNSLQDRRERCWHGFEPGASNTDNIRRIPDLGEHIENTHISWQVALRLLVILPVLFGPAVASISAMRQSAVIPASLTTLAHRATSDLMMS